MMHRTQHLVAGLAAAYRAAHPEEESDPQPSPSAEQAEAAGVAALHAALYGTPLPPTRTEENNHD